MELFATQKDFLASLVFILNKQSTYQDVVEQGDDSLNLSRFVFLLTLTPFSSLSSG